jgi:glycosyltransferase involved in cell wall biosynthesis
MAALSPRRVLVLAYYFPPVGGGGVQRTRKFVEYLPEHGYEPVVVTGPAARSLDWAPDDASLHAGIPDETEVLRLPGPEPPLTRARSRAERWLRIQEPPVRWWIDGVVATAREAARRADVIYASMSPFGTGQAAARLARATGRPWVADLRDPWALDEWLVYTTRLHRRLEMRLMRRTLASAAAIVMNTPEATAQLLRHFPELGDRPVVTIPNGFDPADFSGPGPVRGDGTFRIVHAGWVHTAGGRRHRRLRLVRRALGGSVPGLDILTRSDVYLLEAVDRLLAERPELRGAVEVHLAGVAAGAGDDRGVARRRGYLAHADTLALMRSADLLFLPMHDLPPGTRARIVPGKTYEYLATGRPILAAVPDGDARDLLARAGDVTLCRPADSAAMARAIAARIDDPGEGTARDPDVLRPFERRRLTADLAGVFDRVLAPQGATGVSMSARTSAVESARS